MSETSNYVCDSTTNNQCFFSFIMHSDLGYYGIKVSNLEAFSLIVVVRNNSVIFKFL